MTDTSNDPKQIVCTGEEVGADEWNPAFGIDSDETVGKGERLYVRRDLYDALSAERDALRDDNRILRTEKHADAEAIATLRDINAENDRLRAALKISEAALSDIGDAHREEGDDLAWCERRAAKAIPIARAALKGENTDE